MNNLKIINTRNFLMTIMILAGMSSCHKEEIKQEKVGKATLTNFSQTKEGDEEEEGILIGMGTYSGGGPVQNATVNLYRSNTTVPFTSETSDSNGKFEMTVPFGTYFIEIIEVNNNSTITNEFNVTGNAYLTIVI